MIQYNKGKTKNTAAIILIFSVLRGINNTGLKGRFPVIVEQNKLKPQGTE